ncbi:MAG: hypothetical protein M9927_04410 [Anaerolineae bacterium]|nr:hypothetical protein [Anaerolineae bacterium]
MNSFTGTKIARSIGTGLYLRVQVQQSGQISLPLSLAAVLAIDVAGGAQPCGSF